MTAADTRGAAITAAGRGWSAFPCRPGDKRPAVNRWEERACSDPGRIARYWPAGANIGIACGPSGLVVIDLDTDEAHEPGSIPAGARHLGELHREHGRAWADTLTVCTPRGGWHLYYSAIPGREIRNSAGKLAPHIDIRGAGGYVVGAGSVAGGRAYRLVLDLPVVQLPGWLAELLSPAQRRPTAPAAPVTGYGLAYGRLRGLVEHVLGGQPGDRNGRLYWAACRCREMVAAGDLDRATAERILTETAVESGLRGGEAEARRTIASAMRPTA